MLPEELAGLEAADFDLSLLGFSEKELTQLLDQDITSGLVDPDDVPEPPDEATTRPGDLWLLGDHRLMCGDSGKPEDVDRLLDGASIHLVNTDPPYNVRVEPRSNNAIAAGNSSFSRNHRKTKETPGKMRAKDRPLANNFVSDEESERLLDGWFGNMGRRLEETIKIARRRQKVVELYLQSWFQTDIARELGISQTTVCHDLKAIQKQWRESSICNFDALRERELCKIDLLEREAWEAWKRSQEPKEPTKVV